jgi:hypothetical protein
MKRKEMIKTGVGIVVSVGVSTIIGSAIKMVSPTEDMGVVKKLCVGVGALVLTSMIGEAVLRYTDAKFEQAVSGAKNMVEEAQAQMD